MPNRPQTPDEEQTDKEQRLRNLAYQTTALIQRMEALAPDLITGHLAGPGFSIRPTDGTWTVT